MATNIQPLDDIVAFVTATWPELAGQFSDERVQAWADEINSGAGRTAEQVRLDILKYIVTDAKVDEYVAASFEDRGLDPATSGETADERIQRISDELQAGSTTFKTLGTTLDQFGTVDTGGGPGTESVGGVDLPVGMRLVKVKNPSGTDAAAIFYLVGTVFGVDVAYEIGDNAALQDMFGSSDVFDEVSTMNQGQFDNSGIITVGPVDEIAGTTESLQAQYERDMREAGLESPPAWMQNDPTAMATFITATNEGWSAERTWVALSQLDSFKGRYTGLDVVMGQLGTTSFTDGIGEYVARETGIRAALLASRGPNADTTPEYVASLVASGWQPAEVGELLALEKRVKGNPAALDNINEILAYQGLDVLNADDFVQFLQDQDASAIDPAYTPSDLFEGINDALRFQALLTEGLDVSTQFATELGTGSSDAIASPEQFTQQAQLAASMIARNVNELDLGKLGLDREDVIAAMFGEARPDGKKSVSEITGILEKFGKERNIAAQGFAQSTAFVNKEGRLITQGFSNI